MPDREFIVDIILKARDETAAAFARATGQMEAFNALAEEQNRKTAEAKQAQTDYAKEVERRSTSEERLNKSLAESKLRNTDAIKALRDYEQAQRRVNQAESEGNRTERIAALSDAANAHKRLTKALQEETEGYKKMNAGAATAMSNRLTQQATLDARLAQTARNEERATRAAEERARREAAAVETAERRKVAATREYERLINDVAQAERHRETARVPTSQRGQREVIRESLDLDVAKARAKLDEFRVSQRARDIELHVRIPDHDIVLAKAKLDAVRGGGSGRGGGGGGGTIPLDDPGGSSAFGRVQQLQQALASLDTSTQGFTAHFRSAFGFAALTLIQPIIALVVGLVGAMGALASAAVAAGTALGTVFLSAIAQGVPVMGLFAAAMDRLKSIMQFVQIGVQQQQQRFIAQYEAAQQSALGINQVTIAQHNYSDALFAAQTAVQNVSVAEHQYSDALFAQQNAVYNVRVAQLGLLTVRQQARRQLQQLILEETNAKLAAQASSLAIVNAQKALAAAVATGGDIQQAQLQLAQAHAQHTQAVVGAQQAIADAAPGSIARQNIQQTVDQGRQAVQQAQHAVIDANVALTQAQRGIVQAQRAVVDAQFQVAQARAAIIQAQQAAAGYNVATAAQLAYLRSQMTQTERSLADNITKIYAMFQGVHGRLRPVTDAILSAFIPLTGQIIKIFNDPRVFGALLNLGNRIGDSIRTITRVIFSNQSINNFIRIVNAAANNMRPLATIVSALFRGIQAVVVAAIPYVHQFIGFISGLITRFANWANSAKGQNWLANWFNVAFGALEAFIGLGASVVKLIAAVIGVGGGAQAGINIIKQLKSWVDRTTDSINRHGSAWTTLHGLWAAAAPALHVVGQILGALVQAFIKLGTSKQGQQAMRDLGTLIVNVLIPAFVQFAQNMGAVIGTIVHFLAKHPELQKALVSIIAGVATVSAGSKALGLVFGPLAGIVGAFGKLAPLLQIAGPALLEMFSNPIVAAIVAAAAAIVGVAAATGNLKNLLHAVEGPFKETWKELKPLVKEFGKALSDLFSQFGGHVSSSRALHDVVKGVIDVIGFLLKGMVVLNPAFMLIKESIIIVTFAIKGFTNTIKTIKNVFEDVARLVGDIVHLRFGKLAGDFLRIGKDILKGLWNGIKGIGGLLIDAVKGMFKPVLDWLGITSPSKRSEGLGKNILEGLWKGLAAIGKFGEKIIGWIGQGIGKLARWLGGIGKDIINWIVQGAEGIANKIVNIGASLGGWLWNGVKTIANDIINIGGKIIDWIVNGIKKAPKAIIDAIKSILPGPLKGVVSSVIGAAGSAAKTVGGFLGLQEGGPVPGFGGGDRHLYALEGGEHIVTKEEVRSAGGHDIIFALRRALGGGHQGGPFGYAQGGAVGGDQGTPESFTKMGLQNPAGQTTQGVKGQMGSVLANLQDFIKKALDDWRDFWNRFNKITDGNLHYEVKLWHDRFNDILGGLVGSDKNLFDEIKGFWDNTNKVVSNQLDTLKKNFKDAYKIFDTDTYNAFWFIWKAASQALTTFGATPPKLQLANVPKFAGGGFIGQMGEKGKDLVHTVLGRGEAVLNWAHQRMVEPALRAYYGFGLDKMFKRVRGEHAGDGDVRGYGGGGYVFPFGKSGWSWSRTDQGVDFGGNAPIGAIGPAVVTYSNPRDGWYPPAPAFMVYQLTDGPDKGRYIYAAEHITNMAPAGTHVQAGQAIAQMVGGIEMGWAAGPQGHQIILPMGAGHLTAAGEDFHKLLIGLTHGQITGGAGFGAGTGATWNDIQEIMVKGKGVLKDTLQAAIKKVTDAANAFGQQQAGQSGAPGGGPIGNLVGNIMQLAAAAAKYAGVPFNPQITGVLLQKESSGGKNLGPSGPLSATGPFQVIPGTFQSFEAPGHGNIRNPFDNALAAFRYIKSRYGTLEHLAQVTGLLSGGYRGYKGGGFVDGARAVIGHVGEWVVNKAQQSKLANWLGTSVGNLRDSLGFTGGPKHFQGGGVIGEDPTYSRVTGVYEDPAGVTVDTTKFTLGALNTYNAAQRVISNKIEKHKQDLTKGIEAFLANYDKIGGDNGILALAAQALQDYINSQTALVQLAAAGVRVINNRLRYGPAQTALQVAQRDLQFTNDEIDRTTRLRREQVDALLAINQQIRRLGRPTSANLQTWQRLQGARQNLINSINTTDQTLAQSYADRYQKQQTAFTAQVTATLRGPNTLTGAQIGAVTLGTAPGRSSALQDSFNNLHNVLSRVGSTIALGVAQMAQGIAQTLQDPRKLAISDEEVIRAASAQHAALQNAYADAAARARRDPRWQSVADDLLQQLEGSVSALVQAEAQALQDAIQSQDTQQQIGNAALTLRDTLAQVLAASSNIAGPANQFAASAMQIQTSRARSAFITQQLGAYQGLLGQAQAQGNIGAINTLTQTIEQLTGELAQANLQTQQLITANRQLAVTILNLQTQASSGFFSAAQGIAQTLGAITGSLNLPALITYAKDAGQALIQEGQKAIENISQALSPDASGAFAFGANQGGASAFLDQLMAAFKQGPQIFADELAQLAPQLAAFESGLPPDQQTLFQNLVQSLVDNTTAQVNNTQQLQQLNATTNQQQFTSSAWTMFREAIFSGLGGLLPQYALTVPSADIGAHITSSGLLYGHRGETVVPAGMRRGQFAGETKYENHFHIDHPLETADPVLFGNAVAWRLNHDPNSR